MKRIPPRGSRRQACGLSLVELMIAMAVSLVLVLAATSMYLATRESQRNIDQASSAHEAASYTLRTLGRELMNAGFFPAARTASAEQVNVLSGYTNITTRAAYDFGIFGCEGASFDPAAGTCGTATAGAPDTLVVSYFTDDAMDASIGHRTDCTGSDVGNAAVNTARVGGGGASVPPALPLFVANHYTLTATSMSIEGRTVSTRSLSCNGNGSGTAAYQAMLAGLDDLQFTYAVYGDSSRVPQRFYTATEVNSLANVVIDGETLRPWARVVAVRVCVIARTYETSAAISEGRYEDCNGNLQAGDRSLRKTYVQVFGVRNRQTSTY
jgi:type IV pilus assembly protein PilW